MCEFAVGDCEFCSEEHDVKNEEEDRDAAVGGEWFGALLF